MNNNQKVYNDSQIKQNELLDEIKKLELQKTRIIKKRKSKILPVIFHNIYNLILFLILIFFISSFIDKISLVTAMQKTIYIVEIYIGVTTISVLGALLAVKIEALIKELLKKKELKLSKTIEEKQNILNIEKSKQKQIIKEITTPSIEDDLIVLECKSNETNNMSNNEVEAPFKPYTRKRKRKRKKDF